MNNFSNNMVFTDAYINQLLFKLYDDEVDKKNKVLNFFSLLRERVYFDKAGITFYKSGISGYEPLDFISFDIDDELINSYNDFYYQFDDTLEVLNYKNSILFRSSDYFNIEARKKSRYFKEYLAPADIEYSIEGTFNDIINGERKGRFALFRGSKKKDFTDDDFRLVSFFQPHLSNVLKGYKNKRVSLGKLFEFLEGKKAVGIAVFDQNYRKIRFNETYQKIIDEKKYTNSVEYNIIKFLQSNKVKENEYNEYSVDHKFEDDALFLEVDCKGNEFVCLLYDLSYFFSKSLNILKGKYSLTTKEFEILHYIIKGAKQEEVARQMFISLHTVKKHLSSTYEKLGIEGHKEVFQKLEVF